jgi:hypothetical protein
MEAQPKWHDDPKVAAAWDAAASAGLDVEAARAGMNSPEIDGIIQQDAADVKEALNKSPKSAIIRPSSIA